MKRFFKVKQLKSKEWILNLIGKKKLKEDKIAKKKSILKAISNKNKFRLRQ